jgi:hypothetical protein
MATAVRERLLVIGQLDQLAGIACGDGGSYLRYSLCPEADAARPAAFAKAAWHCRACPLCR